MLQLSICSVDVARNVDLCSAVIGTSNCRIPCSNPQLQTWFILTQNTTEVSVLSKDLLVSFSAALANLWHTVFMHLDG